MRLFISHGVVNKKSFVAQKKTLPSKNQRKDFFNVTILNTTSDLILLSKFLVYARVRAGGTLPSVRDRNMHSARSPSILRCCCAAECLQCNKCIRKYQDSGGVRLHLSSYLPALSNSRKLVFEFPCSSFYFLFVEEVDSGGNGKLIKADS